MLSDSYETDSLVAVTALEEYIVRRGLAHPANLLLEMHRPLVGIGHSLWCVASPVISIFVKSPLMRAIEAVLSNPTAYEELQRRIELQLTREPIRGS